MGLRWGQEQKLRRYNMNTYNILAIAINIEVVEQDLISRMEI